MWNNLKSNALEISLREHLHDNLLFLDRYERIEIQSIEIVLNKNIVPRCEVSKAVEEAIYNAIKQETKEILIKLAILQAGENASIKDIFNKYASNYCSTHLSTPSLEDFEEHQCKYCSHANECPYYLDKNNYRLKADQEEAQEYCNRQDRCKECIDNTVCSYECVTVDNQFAILGQPLTDSLFVRKEDFVEYKFRTEWRKYIDEIDALCTDYSMDNMNMF